MKHQKTKQNTKKQEKNMQTFLHTKKEKNQLTICKKNNTKKQYDNRKNIIPLSLITFFCLFTNNLFCVKPPTQYLENIGLSLCQTTPTNIIKIKKRIFNRPRFSIKFNIAASNLKKIEKDIDLIEFLQYTLPSIELSSSELRELFKLILKKNLHFTFFSNLHLYKLELEDKVLLAHWYIENYSQDNKSLAHLQAFSLPFKQHIVAMKRLINKSQNIKNKIEKAKVKPEEFLEILIGVDFWKQKTDDLRQSIKTLVLYFPELFPYKDIGKMPFDAINSRTISLQILSQVIKEMDYKKDFSNDPLKYIEAITSFPLSKTRKITNASPLDILFPVIRSILLIQENMNLPAFDKLKIDDEFFTSRKKLKKLRNILTKLELLLVLHQLEKGLEKIKYWNILLDQIFNANYNFPYNSYNKISERLDKQIDQLFKAQITSILLRTKPEDIETLNNSWPGFDKIKRLLIRLSEDTQKTELFREIDRILFTSALDIYEGSSKFEQYKFSGYKGDAIDIRSAQEQLSPLETDKVKEWKKQRTTAQIFHDMNTDTEYVIVTVITADPFTALTIADMTPGVPSCLLIDRGEFIETLPSFAIDANNLSIAGFAISQNQFKSLKDYIKVKEIIKNNQATIFYDGTSMKFTFYKNTDKITEQKNEKSATEVTIQHAHSRGILRLGSNEDLDPAIVIDNNYSLTHPASNIVQLQQEQLIKELEEAVDAANKSKRIFITNSRNHSGTFTDKSGTLGQAVAGYFTIHSSNHSSKN